MSEELPCIGGDAFESVVGRANVPVMCVFGSSGSGPCRRQVADCPAIARKMSRAADVYAVDIDADRQIAARFNIHSIPTVIIFAEGIERSRFIGVQRIETLVAALERWSRPRSSIPASQERA